MSKGRLEAFSDGVLAIIITIMVLELRPPDEVTLDALLPLGATVFSYVLSFVMIGIYWNNHHHLLQAARTITGSVLWANLHLLFWLSLFPFGTAWMGEHSFAAVPVAAYGVILLCAALAYTILARILVRVQPEESPLRAALGVRDRKGDASLALYVAGIAVASFVPLAAVGCYILVAAIWFIPDTRIERVFAR